MKKLKDRNTKWNNVDKLSTYQHLSPFKPFVNWLIIDFFGFIHDFGGINYLYSINP